MFVYRLTGATGGNPTAADLQAALAAYLARFRAYPSILFVNPQSMAAGLQAPIGVLVEADQRMPRGVVAFGTPADEAPAAADQLATEAA